jgi:hypothetical protein
MVRAFLNKEHGMEYIDQASLDLIDWHTKEAKRYLLDHLDAIAGPSEAPKAYEVPKSLTLEEARNPAVLLRYLAGIADNSIAVEMPLDPHPRGKPPTTE